MPSLTDRSLRALTSLQRLECVQLSGCNITGAALFAFTMRPLPDTVLHCKHEIRLSDSKLFPDVLEDFLHQVLQQQTDSWRPLRSTHTSLHLVNESKSEMARETVDRLVDLAAKVRATHPSLQLRGLIRGRMDRSENATITATGGGGGNDTAVAEIIFSTAPATTTATTTASRSDPGLWYYGGFGHESGWLADSSSRRHFRERKIDDVFVLRQYIDDQEEDEDEDEDDDMWQEDEEDEDFI